MGNVAPLGANPIWATPLGKPKKKTKEAPPLTVPEPEPAPAPAQPKPEQVPA